MEDNYNGRRKKTVWKRIGTQHFEERGPGGGEKGPSKK
jgi:hypothetical protein